MKINKLVKKFGRRKILFIIVLLCVIFLVVMIGLLNKNADNKNDDKNVEYRPKAEEGSTTPPTVETNDDNNDKSTQPLAKESNNIQISEPKTGTKIANGTEVSGQVGDKMGILGYKIKGIRGGVLVDYLTDISTTSKNQDFKFSVGFEKEPTQGDTGSLEVYILKDGNKIDFTSVEVSF